jgi:hypothetical protein
VNFSTTDRKYSNVKKFLDDVGEKTEKYVEGELHKIPSQRRKALEKEMQERRECETKKNRKN